MTTTLTPSPRKLSTEPRRSDKVFRGVVTGGGLSSLVILGLITIFLAYRGFEIFRVEGIRDVGEECAPMIYTYNPEEIKRVEKLLPLINHLLQQLSIAIVAHYNPYSLGPVAKDSCQRLGQILSPKPSVCQKIMHARDTSLRLNTRDF
jgi:ABC-type phosphate transport system permease subunit